MRASRANAVASNPSGSVPLRARGGHRASGYGLEAGRRRDLRFVAAGCRAEAGACPGVGQRGAHRRTPCQEQPRDDHDRHHDEPDQQDAHELLGEAQVRCERGETQARGEARDRAEPARARRGRGGCSGRGAGPGCGGSAGGAGHHRVARRACPWRGSGGGVRRARGRGPGLRRRRGRLRRSRSLALHSEAATAGHAAGIGKIRGHEGGQGGDGETSGETIVHERLRQVTCGESDPGEAGGGLAAGAVVVQ